MKFLCTDDWHLRTLSPRYRIDNYLETSFSKVNSIFNLAKEEHCVAILHAGDLCDSPDQSNSVVVKIIKLCRQYKIPFYIVAGQHDLLYRKFSNTTLAVLVEAGVVTMLNSDPIIYDDINIYGASWDEEIPKVKDKKATNLLIIHRMIVKDKPLWAKQTEYINAKSILNEYKDYQLIVSGDNHNSFIYTTDNQTLINCGSLMRTTIAQREHKPCCYIVDTDTNECTQYYIPISPVNEVMDLELADEQKERNLALEEFMTNLSIEYRPDLSFEENLQNLIKLNNTDNIIQSIIKSFLIKWHHKNGGK